MGVREGATSEMSVPASPRPRVSVSPCLRVSSRLARRHQAFTLVELLVAVALATMLLLILTKIFGTAINLTSRSDAQTATYQNARYLLDRLEREISAALGNLGAGARQPYFRINNVDYIDPRTSSSWMLPEPTRFGKLTVAPVVLAGTNNKQGRLADELKQWRLNEWRNLIVVANPDSAPSSQSWYRIVSNDTNSLVVEDIYGADIDFTGVGINTIYAIHYQWGRMEFVSAIDGKDYEDGVIPTPNPYGTPPEYDICEVGYQVTVSSTAVPKSPELTSRLKRWVAYDQKFTSPSTSQGSDRTLWRARDESNPPTSTEETDVDDDDELGSNVTDFFIEYYDPVAKKFLPGWYTAGSITQAASDYSNPPGGISWTEFTSLPPAVRVTLRIVGDARLSARTFILVIPIPASDR